MPIYEYECSKCGKTMEVIQKMSDRPLKKHAGCGGTLTKLISAGSFQFKGTGWYVTDYARKPAQEGTESSKDGKKETSKETKDSNESKQTKEAASNGSKEGSSGKSATEKTSRKDRSSKD